MSVVFIEVEREEEVWLGQPLKEVERDKVVVTNKDSVLVTDK